MTPSFEAVRNFRARRTNAFSPLKSDPGGSKISYSFMRKHRLQFALCSLRSRRWIAAALLPFLLFAQFATAAYLCPQLTQAVSQSASMPVNCDTANADVDQPVLCKAHCEADARAAGSTADVVPPVLAFDSHPAWHMPARSMAVTRIAPPNELPRGGPPLYLLHRVLRI